MFNRVKNRNTGYSEGLFPKTTHIENNTFDSISGATAFKIEEKVETSSTPETSIVPETEIKADPVNSENLASGISIENASYIENQSGPDAVFDNEINQPEVNEKVEEEFTPQLFADDSSNNLEEDANKMEEPREEQNEKLFDQENSNEEEDFEIPAFLRRQKF